jgi:membrane protease YdiL (CAAX protease family)
MKKSLFLNLLFRWKPQKLALIGFAVGIAIVLLSLILNYVKGNIYLSIIVRDILMILLFGIGIPLFIIKRENNLKAYGLHLNRWYIYLPVNLILGFLLLLMFLKVSPLPSNFSLTKDIIWKITYIMFAGIFETIAFYSFIRTAIERSFGIIPAILVTAIFYSLHHAGFQPEYGKLLLVGILYASIFRIGNSSLLIYPFFWGAGACYDVLIQSKAVSEIEYPQIRSLILFIGICLIAIFLMIKMRSKPAVKNSDKSRKDRKGE